MGLTTKRRTRWVLAALAGVAVAAAVDGTRLARDAATNAAIQAAGATGKPLAEAPGQPAEVRFAQAYAQAASGAREAALNRYRALQGSQGDGPIGQAARYNSANLLVAQAVEVRASTQPGQAIALLELAKEYYRDVLRAGVRGATDPSADALAWDVRYNLERAQRLLPDADEADGEPPVQAENRERAATTMRGYSPGLP